MPYKVTKNLRKVADHWSKDEPLLNANNFYMSPLTRRYIIETAYGENFVQRYQDNSFYAEDIFISQYLRGKKVEQILSLCAGFGSVERRFVSQLGNVKLCLGVDIAEGALETSRKRAAEAGMNCLSYEMADINKYSWKEKQYDLVIANGALHHLSNLESVLEGIRYTLSPDGLLYCCEYVGPSYMDHSPRQLQIINAAAFLVPPELRGRKGAPLFINKVPFHSVLRFYSAAAREVRPEWPYLKKIAASMGKKLLRFCQDDFDFGVVYISPKNLLLKSDPSECVRSSEIVKLVKDYFPNVEIRPFGGGILQHALDEKFYINFDSNNLLHVKSFEMLCELERHFMATGTIGIENAFIIARS